uniref:Uncharacterized protein n=1 Tax=Oryza punctata TaxID=4537 RepID=A0A0E0LIT6_ORYPU
MKVEQQLHKIFKLCGFPSEEYWKKSKLPHATIFKPQQPYKRCIREAFKDFPPSSLPLVETLLAIDPAEHQTATSTLQSEERVEKRKEREENNPAPWKSVSEECAGYMWEFLTGMAALAYCSNVEVIA